MKQTVVMFNIPVGNPSCQRGWLTPSFIVISSGFLQDIDLEQSARPLLLISLRLFHCTCIFTLHSPDCRRFKRSNPYSRTADWNIPLLFLLSIIGCHWCYYYRWSAASSSRRETARASTNAWTSRCGFRGMWSGGNCTWLRGTSSAKLSDYRQCNFIFELPKRKVTCGVFASKVVHLQ